MVYDTAIVSAFNGQDICVVLLQLQSMFRCTTAEAKAVSVQAMEDGLTQEELFEFTNIDPWFLSQFAGLHQARCPCLAYAADL